MQIRPLATSDIDLLRDIDNTVESSEYLHVEVTGEKLATGWRLARRPLRQRRVTPAALSEETAFIARQLAAGHDEGLALVTDYDGSLLALLLAQPDLEHKTLRLIDLRIDYDYRRQGMGTALVYMLMQHAREKEYRAVVAESRTDNTTAADFLVRLGFRLGGLDTLRFSNHDLVKEEATLVWYHTLNEGPIE